MGYDVVNESEGIWTFRKHEDGFISAPGAGIIQETDLMSMNLLSNETGDLLIKDKSSVVIENLNPSVDIYFSENDEMPSSSHDKGGQDTDVAAANLSLSTVKEDQTMSCSSSHMNPNWLKDLKLNLKSEIIDKCAVKVSDAVSANAFIEDVKERREIRNMIINAVVDRIILVFGGVSRPLIREVRQLVVELQFIYPAMFKEDSSTGYGFGGRKGGDALAHHLLDRVRAKDGISSKAVSESVGADDSALQIKPKKGKRKLVYGKYKFELKDCNNQFTHFVPGVDNQKWYKIVPCTNAIAIRRANEETSFDSRELVYEKNREQLHSQFR